VVGGSGPAQQRLGFGTGSFYVGQSQKDCPFPKEIGGIQFAEKGSAFPIGDVDAQFLYQPFRQKSSPGSKGNINVRQRGIAEGF